MFDKVKIPVYKAALCSAEVLEKANKTNALSQKKIVKNLILGVGGKIANRYSPQT